MAFTEQMMREERMRAFRARQVERGIRANNRPAQRQNSTKRNSAQPSGGTVSNSTH